MTQKCLGEEGRTGGGAPGFSIVVVAHSLSDEALHLPSLVTSESVASTRQIGMAREGILVVGGYMYGSSNLGVHFC